MSCVIFWSMVQSMIRSHCILQIEFVFVMILWSWHRHICCIILCNFSKVINYRKLWFDFHFIWLLTEIYTRTFFSVLPVKPNIPWKWLLYLSMNLYNDNRKSLLFRYFLSIQIYMRGFYHLNIFSKVAKKDKKEIKFN